MVLWLAGWLLETRNESCGDDVVVEHVTKDPVWECPHGFSWFGSVLLLEAAWDARIVPEWVLQLPLLLFVVVVVVVLVEEKKISCRKTLVKGFYHCSGR